MKKKGIRRKVLVRLFIFAIAIVILAGGLTGYRYYRTQMNQIETQIYGYLRTASDLIDGDRIEGYLQTRTPDEYYDTILEYLTKTCEQTEMKLFYVFVPYEEDLVYVWQTDEDPYAWLGYRENYMDGGKETRDMTFRKDPVQKITFYQDPTYGNIGCGFYPVFDSKGEPVALVGLDLSTPDIVKGIISFIVMLFVVILLGTIIAGIFYYFSLSRQIVNPISRLNEATKEITSNLEKDVEMPDINIHTGDELEELSESYINMYKDIRHYIKENAEISAEKGRIDAELGVATQIQADMLPRIFPAFPGRAEFDLYATMKPAKEVGGDFYDYFFADEDHLVLVMADVSGKGVPAALFMVIAKTLIKNRAQMGKSPAEILKDVNEELCENNEAELFVTVWLAIIELSTGKGVAANAGHEHPALCRAGGQWELVEYRHSVAVAALEGVNFKEHGFEIHPGDAIFVYTDGVAEATSTEEELFGTDRMLAALNRNSDAAPEKILENVRDDLSAFVGDASQFDDITMMCLKYHGPKEK